MSEARKWFHTAPKVYVMRTRKKVKMTLELSTDHQKLLRSDSSWLEQALKVGGLILKIAFICCSASQRGFKHFFQNFWEGFNNAHNSRWRAKLHKRCLEPHCDKAQLGYWARPEGVTYALSVANRPWKHNVDRCRSRRVFMLWKHIAHNAAVLCEASLLRLSHRQNTSLSWGFWWWSSNSCFSRSRRPDGSGRRLGQHGWCGTSADQCKRGQRGAPAAVVAYQKTSREFVAWSLTDNRGRHRWRRRRHSQDSPSRSAIDKIHNIASGNLHRVITSTSHTPDDKCHDPAQRDRRRDKAGGAALLGWRTVSGGGCESRD